MVQICGGNRHSLIFFLHLCSERVSSFGIKFCEIILLIPGGSFLGNLAHIRAGRCLSSFPSEIDGGM